MSYSSDNFRMSTFDTMMPIDTMSQINHQVENNVQSRIDELKADIANKTIYAIEENLKDTSSNKVSDLESKKMEKQISKKKAKMHAPAKKKSNVKNKNSKNSKKIKKSKSLKNLKKETTQITKEEEEIASNIEKIKLNILNYSNFNNQAENQTVNDCEIEDDSTSQNLEFDEHFSNIEKLTSLILNDNFYKVKTTISLLDAKSISEENINKYEFQIKSLNTMMINKNIDNKYKKYIDRCEVIIKRIYAIKCFKFIFAFIKKSYFEKAVFIQDYHALPLNKRYIASNVLFKIYRDMVCFEDEIILTAHLIKTTQIPDLIFSYNNSNISGVKFKDIPIEMYDGISKLNYLEKIALQDGANEANNQLYSVKLNNIPIINDKGIIEISYKQLCLDYKNMYNFDIYVKFSDFSFEPIKETMKTDYDNDNIFDNINDNIYDCEDISLMIEKSLTQDLPYPNSSLFLTPEFTLSNNPIEIDFCNYTFMDDSIDDRINDSLDNIVNDKSDNYENENSEEEFSNQEEFSMQEKIDKVELLQYLSSKFCNEVRTL